MASNTSMPRYFLILNLSDCQLALHSLSNVHGIVNISQIMHHF